MKKHSPGFLKRVAEAVKHIREISVAEFQRDPTAYILVDVREDREWEHAHASDAVHIGKGVLERDIEKHYPDRDTPLVLYCGGGYRSAIAAESLQRMGYENVYSLAGGFRAWRAANCPILEST